MDTLIAIGTIIGIVAATLTIITGGRQVSRDWTAWQRKQKQQKTKEKQQPAQHPPQQ